MPAAVPIMIGLMAGGTALDVYGKIKAGNAAKKAGDLAGEIEDVYAGENELSAQDAELRGALDEQQVRRVVRGTIGSQRAGFASQGVEVGSGSALDVQADTAYLGELDALTVRNNAAREAHGYRVEAEQARRRGKYARMEGEQAKSASRISAIGTIIGSAATAAQIGYQYGSGRGLNSAGGRP